MRNCNIAKRDKNADDLVNENIRFREVLVIGPQGEAMGIMARNDAINKAYEYNLDLICVAASANPPVCKILDYGKYRFEQQKKAKEAKKNQHVTEVKAQRLSPVIDTNDFNTKVRQTMSWLEEGNRVRLEMKFRGRMMTRQDVGKKVMQDFIAALSDVATVDKQPNMEGNVMSCTMSPVKK